MLQCLASLLFGGTNKIKYEKIGLAPQQELVQLKHIEKMFPETLSASSSSVAVYRNLNYQLIKVHSNVKSCVLEVLNSTSKQLDVRWAQLRFSMKDIIDINHLPQCLVSKQFFRKKEEDISDWSVNFETSGLMFVFTNSIYYTFPRLATRAHGLHINSVPFSALLELVTTCADESEEVVSLHLRVTKNILARVKYYNQLIARLRDHFNAYAETIWLMYWYRQKFKRVSVFDNDYLKLGVKSLQRSTEDFDLELELLFGPDDAFAQLIGPENNVYS